MQTTLSRSGQVRLLAAVVLAGLCSDSIVRAQSNAGDTAPQNKTLTTGDGQPIAITYYPAIAKANPGGLQEAGVVVLLHGDDKGRIHWDKAAANVTPFPKYLQDKGFAVITVDLRKFGDSKSVTGQTAIKTIDYELMANQDLPAVKQFIYEEHQAKRLNMNKMALIAAGPTTPVALAFAANDWSMPPHDDAPDGGNKTPRGQDVRAIVLLSPESGGGRIASTKSINFLKNPQFGIAFLVISGAHDTTDKGQATKLFELMQTGQRKDETQRVYMLSPNLKDRGVFLMGKTPEAVEIPIADRFLKMHLADVLSEWRDRRNQVTGK